MDYINNLQYSKFYEYHSYIAQIEAERSLVQLNTMDYPSMSRDNRNKFYKSLHKKAYPDYKPKTVTFEEFARKQK